MLNEAREAKKLILKQAAEDWNDPEVSINLSMLGNEIYESTYKA